MTSFTRKLFNRDPAAVMAFWTDSKAERDRTPFERGFQRPVTVPVIFGKRATRPAHLPCPFQQSFCMRNGLSALECPICKGGAK